ncbi:AIC_G0036460.mRNA.1.CDS.1 [Saccharomyces cerevisiae]|nr:AIC_G0036460.mRNA.1.CDS.1 [Saccharomyces cerevisiae]CAI6802596.1 AIC_G0036460.mRNA.1.CDS.1 [Saccharomyces cerevisiae]
MMTILLQIVGIIEAHPIFLRRPVITTQESNEFSEENNISGIDWVEDRNGSSLIIGTDYGIMRWNINSWARRSFSSYDLC